MMLTPMTTRTLTVEQVDARARSAIEAALLYFGIQGEQPVQFMHERPAEKDASASCTYEADYLRATIRVDTDYYQCYPMCIWKDMGHEVAHLASKELMAFRAFLPEEPELRRTVYTTAVEQLTTRLERMFVRDCPEPDWNDVPQT